MARSPMTEAQKRAAAVDWLSGKSWRAVGKAFGAHPKYLQAQARRLGYLEAHQVRTCPCCANPKPLPEFTRAGAQGKEAIMHECNDCMARQTARQRLDVPLIEDDLERRRQASVDAARRYLTRLRQRRQAEAITLGRESE